MGLNNQISKFNETILIIMTNIFGHETNIFTDREPPCIKNKVKTPIKEKRKIYQLYLKNQSKILATKLETLQKFIYETLWSCKSKHYENI